MDRAPLPWIVFVSLAAALFLLYGCDKEWPMIQAWEADSEAADRGTGVIVLPQDCFYPTAGPIGTEITIQGKGEVFPAGFIRFNFSGQGKVEIVHERASNSLRIAVPPGAISGAFGFTVSGRSEKYDYAFPTPDLFRAYTVDFPGFKVTGLEYKHPFSP